VKQKNLVLVAVAVVCGLVAAFLTSQMGAKGRAKVEEVQVPVAAKEIPIGTRMPKDPQELAKWVKMKPFPKDSAPQAFVPTLEDMAEKYVMNRTYRENEPLNPMDVSASGMMSPPEGFGMMSLPIQADAAVSGFIRPGTHVDVWLSVLKRKSNHYVAFPMFLDMLVLAVNQDASGIGAAGGAYQAVSMVSVAVKPEHTELFQLAISRAAMLRLVLRHPEKGKESAYEKVPAPDKIRDILTDKEEEADPTRKEEKKPELVKIKVATKEIAAQTELTADLIASSFRDQEVQVEKVPANAIRNLSEHVGRFLQKDLAENQFVPLSYLGEKKAEVAPQPMVAQKDPDPMTPQGPTKPGPGPGDGASPKHEQPLPVLPKVEKKPKPEYTYMSVSGASGVTWYRYLKLPNGESRLVGAVKAGDEEPEEPKESKSEKTRPSEGRVD
jgi:Flp pilus assembly protein CpaB